MRFHHWIRHLFNTCCHDCGNHLWVICFLTLGLGMSLDHMHWFITLNLHASQVPFGVHECTVHCLCSLATLLARAKFQDLLFQEWTFTLLWIGAPPGHHVGISMLITGQIFNAKLVCREGLQPPASNSQSVTQ